MILPIILAISTNNISVNQFYPNVPTQFYVASNEKITNVTEIDFDTFTSKGMCVTIKRTYWDKDITIENYIDGNQANHKYVEEELDSAQFTCYLKEPINPDGP
jgi:hypothetical protein